MEMAGLVSGCVLGKTTQERVEGHLERANKEQKSGKVLGHDCKISSG